MGDLFYVDEYKQIIKSIPTTESSIGHKHLKPKGAFISDL
jgi:hypothetical protein